MVGVPGAGKSTAARALSQTWGLQVLDLDSIYWAANWCPRPTPTFLNDVRHFTSEAPEWIVEGVYPQAADILLTTATMIIWLDVSLARSAWRVTRRAIRRLLTGEILHGGNRESLRSLFGRDSITIYAITQHKRLRETARRVSGVVTDHGGLSLSFSTNADFDRWVTDVASTMRAAAAGDEHTT